MFRVFILLTAATALLGADKVRLQVDFEDRDLSGWILPSPADWAIGSEAGNHFLRLVKAGEIGAPRRPIQYAIRKNLCVGDFTLQVKVRRTGKSMLVAFGYQDTLHFYYAHLSSDSGDHAVHNGLFKVDGGERVRIGGHGSAPVLPEAAWQQVRIVRDVSTGKMEVFAGSDPHPRFSHIDRSFRFGRIGLGSFNETGDFDDFRLEGHPSSECR